MDYSRFFTDVTKRRAPSQLRALAKTFYTTAEKSYLLSGGLPSPQIFLFNEANFHFKNGTVLHLNEAMMEVAQQYGVTEGYPPLLEILHDFQKRLHNPPNNNWTVALTNGAQDAICKAMSMVLDEGDYVIGGEHSYSGTLEPLRAIGVKYLEVEEDGDGLRPQSLRKVIAQWTKNRNSNSDDGIIKVIYVVPNGGNPNPQTVATNRRREIYQIAQENNILIVEDDPYQFIVFDQELPPSFLSLDTDGRVIRCDSFSKTIAPGFRLGCVTAAAPLVEKIVFHVQVSSQQSCCLTQVVLYKLLSEWGFEGYMKNAKSACEVFKKQKNLMIHYAKKYLTGLMEWDEPSGGMFMWMKLKNLENSYTVCDKAIEKGALFAAGGIFKYDNSPSPYIRISFSMGTEDDFDNAFRILAEVIHELQQQNGYNNHINAD